MRNESRQMNMGLWGFYLKMTLFLLLTLVLAPFYVLMLVLSFGCRHAVGSKLVQAYSKICLSIFRVRIAQEPDSETPVRRKGLLIVSNHTSFLDIFVLSALFGALFVSKAEVKYYPIIGQVAWLAGVIFFDRGESKERLRVLRTIAKSCSDRILAIFPQGTTSSRKRRLPFKRGVFKAVELNPDISLLPVTIHYEEDKEIAWENPQSLRENALRVCAQRRIHVKVTLHDLVTIDDYRGKTPSQVCRMVEDTVLLPRQGEGARHLRRRAGRTD